MNLFLWRPKGLVNSPFWTPSLTRPFALYHAHQRSSEQIEKDRLRHRTAYKRNKEILDNPDATKQPSDFYWYVSRYSNDETWREERREYFRARYARDLKGDKDFLMRQNLTGWARRLPWFRELPWKSYRPVLYNKPIERYCVGCKWTRPGGRRVYWQDLVDPDVYLCTKCYIPSENPDWSKIMPKGYEDVKDIKTLKARKEQLDPSKAPPS